jgi:hypothetical protein
MVRYRVKPERVEEHEGLVRAVFAALAETAVSGIRYAAYREPDGVSFVHLALVEGQANPLQAIEAFRAFTAKIAERCDAPPVTVDLEEIGAHGL